VELQVGLDSPQSHESVASGAPPELDVEIVTGNPLADIAWRAVDGGLLSRETVEALDIEAKPDDDMACVKQLLTLLVAATSGGRHGRTAPRILDAEAIAAKMGIRGVTNVKFRTDLLLLLLGRYQSRTAKWACDGFEHGFDVYSNAREAARQSALAAASFVAPVYHPNPAPKTAELADALDKTIKEEEEAGFAPVVPDEVAAIISGIEAYPVYTIEKKLFGQVLIGKSRFIQNLSYGESSVNDDIEDEDSTLKYTTVADALEELIPMIERAKREGSTVYLTLADLLKAYRGVCVRPDQWRRLAFWHKGQLRFQTRLPFGLKSACKIFSTISQLLCWIMRNILRVPCTKGYLDDFFMAAIGEQRAGDGLDVFLLLCRLLGIDVNMDKLITPRTTATFLGIEIDTCNETTALPAARLVRLRTVIAEWLGKQTATAKEMQSLAGSLIFATRVIPAGRVFMQRIFRALRGLEKSRKRETAITEDLSRDLRWWATFLPLTNGSRKMREPEFTYPDDLQLWSDASDIGGGAYWKDQWWFVRWEHDLAFMRDTPIAVRELFCVVTCALTWRHEWKETMMFFHCDNTNSIVQIKKGSARNDDASHLIRVLHFAAARNDFEIKIEYIRSKENSGADALSKSDFERFFLSVPTARSQPVVPTLPPWTDDPNWELAMARSVSDKMQQALSDQAL